ncbi:MAG: hypothetical protein ACQET7_04575 [Thermodesulfobacteriota bacterium]
MHPPTRMAGPVFLVVLVTAWALAAGYGRAAVLWADQEGRRVLSLDTSLKGTALLSRAQGDPAAAGKRDSAVGLLRARFELKYDHAGMMNTGFAYEHRMRRQTGTVAGAVLNILPGDEPASYRITRLDRPVSRSGETFLWRHEIDRALISFHPAWGEVTLGRQAIGLGRGRLFSAVDMFAPFSPAEVDREWRRGVDAARVEYHLSGTSSLECIGVFGNSWQDSAFLARVRGYLGAVDGEFLLGRRGDDRLAAMITSAALWDAAVHAEAALFKIGEARPGFGILGRDRLVAKAVLGASYTFNMGNGLTLLGEYHYSGFGLHDPREAARLLATDRPLQKRFLRGDTQTLGRHNLGLQASYPVNEAANAGLLILTSLRDGSGLVSPSVVWDVRRNVSLLAGAYAPWGPRPSGNVLRSEYGGTPWSLFLQVNIYY